MKRNPLRNLKMSWKLFIGYLIACLIPLSIGSIVFYNTAVDLLEDSAMEFMNNFNSQIVMNLDEFCEEFDRLTQSVLVDNELFSQLNGSNTSSMYAKLEQQNSLRKIATRLMMIHPDIEMVTLLTDDEQLYSVGNTGDQIISDELLKEGWLDNIKSSGKILTITEAHDCPYYDKNQDKIVITIGRRLLNSSGKSIGMLLIDFKQSELIHISESFLTAQNQYNIRICVTNMENKLLYDSDIASGKVGWGNNDFNNILNQPEDDYMVLAHDTEQYGLRVYTVIHKNDLLYQVREIKSMATQLIGICVLLVFVFSIVLSQTITRPLNRLQQGMNRMGNGQYEILAIETADAEIGQVVTTYNQMVMKIKNLIEQVYMADIKQKNAKFLALQTQINPHMLFNMLESIRMKALMNDDEEVADMLKLLAKMFRATLYDNASSHKIKDEIEYLYSYVRLQNMKFRNLFFLEVDVEETILDANIISIVFQPVIENSIEHGIRGVTVPLHIKLEGRMKDDSKIIFRIEDDGKGIQPEQLQKIQQQLENIGTEGQLDTKVEEERKSIGLINIAERIKLHYGNAYYLKVLWSNEKSTCIEICIPVQYKEMSYEIQHIDS